MHVGDDADRLGPPLLQAVGVTGLAEAVGDVGDQVPELGQVHTVATGVQPGGAGPLTHPRVGDVDVPSGLAGLLGLRGRLGVEPCDRFPDTTFSMVGPPRVVSSGASCAST